ncbi:MAG: hypothetical protein ABIK54_07110, partial [candidate division WOR-3 bacterium]
MKAFQVQFAIPLVLNFFLSISAQEIVWLKRFDTGRLDYLASGALDPSGSLIVCGVTGDYGTRDVTLIKYTSDGETLWVRTYDGGADEVGLDCAVGNDGGVVVCGRHHPASYYFLVKYDYNGELVWAITDTVGDLLPNLNSVVVDESLNIYATGKAINNEAEEDWLFLEYNADGNLLQRQVFDLGYIDWETINSFNKLSDGNLVGVGTIGYGFPPVLNLIILKFTRTGDTLWTRMLDVKPQDDAYDITADSEC